MATSVLVWLLIGLLAGVLAHWRDPDDSIGWVGFVLLGMTGSLVGGGLASFFELARNPWAPVDLLAATAGAVSVVAMGILSTRPRTIA
jgi:uncharacterized membrane protein YeaQ/YmgE (transglycosylase-associated protein family)